MATVCVGVLTGCIQAERDSRKIESIPEVDVAAGIQDDFNLIEKDGVLYFKSIGQGVVTWNPQNRTFLLPLLADNCSLVETRDGVLCYVMDSKKVYYLKSDGVTYITTIQCEDAYDVRVIDVIDDEVFWVNGILNSCTSFFCTEVNGQNSELLFTVEDHIDHTMLIDDKIYYITSGNYIGVYDMSVKMQYVLNEDFCNERLTLCAFTENEIVVSDGQAVYSISYENGNTELIRLVRETGTVHSVSGSILYFIDDDKKLVRLDISTGEFSELNDDSLLLQSVELCAGENGVYCYYPYGDLAGVHYYDMEQDAIRVVFQIRG